MGHARDMVRIEGGTFEMGSTNFYPDEGPVHERTVQPYWVDRFPVTNDEYARFVADTGYVTVAERPLDPADFPGLDPSDLAPGSMVFTPTAGPVGLRDWRAWWRWQPGANWRQPFGPGSTVEGQARHPVVHVALEDATAYATWAGARLLTEAEHEYAALGGASGSPFAWGEEPYPGGVAQANTWLGDFPYRNLGVGGTAPVGSYPANGYDLYDMIGNVWEWTSDRYHPRHIVPALGAADAGDRENLLTQPTAESPAAVHHVLKGGSFLCSPQYCLRFRPAARSPQTPDTSMSHIGFRCARDAA